MNSFKSMNTRLEIKNKYNDNNEKSIFNQRNNEDINLFQKNNKNLVIDFDNKLDKNKLFELNQSFKYDSKDNSSIFNGKGNGINYDNLFDRNSVNTRFIDDIDDISSQNITKISTPVTSVDNITTTQNNTTTTIANKTDMPHTYGQEFKTYEKKIKLDRTTLEKEINTFKTTKSDFNTKIKTENLNIENQQNKLKKIKIDLEQKYNEFLQMKQFVIIEQNKIKKEKNSHETQAKIHLINKKKQSELSIKLQNWSNQNIIQKKNIDEEHRKLNDKIESFNLTQLQMIEEIEQKKRELIDIYKKNLQIKKKNDEFVSEKKILEDRINIKIKIMESQIDKNNIYEESLAEKEINLKKKNLDKTKLIYIIKNKLKHTVDENMINLYLDRYNMIYEDDIDKLPLVIKELNSLYSINTVLSTNIKDTNIKDTNIKDTIIPVSSSTDKSANLITDNQIGDIGDIGDEIHDTDNQITDNQITDNQITDNQIGDIGDEIHDTDNQITDNQITDNQVGDICDEIHDIDNQIGDTCDIGDEIHDTDNQIIKTELIEKNNKELDMDQINNYQQLLEKEGLLK